MQQTAIMGSTGSVGVNTLNVIARNADDYQVFALTADSSWEHLAKQCHAHTPRFAVLRDSAHLSDLTDAVRDLPTEVLGGEDALDFVASHREVDAVMAAIVGAAGLSSTLAAVRAGKRVLLANKESLVMSGQLFMAEANRCGAVVLPIDSEHNAIFQCLANGSSDHSVGVRRLILTGSGGPLLHTPLEQLPHVSPDQACAHPNWKMGRKISVDSATMMNKGLELLEASLLFSMPSKQVDVLLHPESVIHSMVEYLDGSVMAQLGVPDMRTPIAHGLAWPRRIESGVAALDLTRLSGLHFEQADTHRFPCLRLAREVAESDQSLSIAMNAANEIAVDHFLRELIRFTDIPIVIETVLTQTTATEVPTIPDVVELDAVSRELARNSINSIQ